MKKEYVLTNGTKYIKQNFDGQYKQVNNLALADTLGVIEECKNQTYSPRKTPELFEFGIDFDKREVCDGAC